MRFIKKIIFMTPLMVLGAGCTPQSTDGQDIRLEQPFVLSNQQWKITEQLTAPNGDHSCSIASGELTVTQHSQDHRVVRQVATANKLNPGDRYKILVSGHNYETPEGWFDAAQSETIIKDLLASDVVYTEMRVATIRQNHEGPTWRSVDNTIPMGDFARQYKACEHFVKP